MQKRLCEGMLSPLKLTSAGQCKAKAELLYLLIIFVLGTEPGALSLLSTSPNPAILSAYLSS